MAESSEGRRVIMICVDGSDYAEGAFNYYVKNVKSDNDYVVFGHAPDLYDFNFASPAVVDQLLKELSAKVRALEEKYRQKIEVLNVPCRFKTGEGKKPGEVLCLMAKEVNASMVVIGTRGLGAIRRAILGSVSDYVIHHAHVPVLVCRPPEHDNQQVLK